MDLKKKPNNKEIPIFICLVIIVIISAFFLPKSITGLDLTIDLSQNKVINPDIYEYEFPEWVKGIAGFWSEGMVDDKTYFTSLQWLIDHGYITISKQTRQTHEYGNTTISCTCDMEER